MNKGKFISFEGSEGVENQLKSKLSNRLEQLGLMFFIQENRVGLSLANQ